MDAMYFSTLPVPITAYNPLVDSTTRDCSQNYTAGIISVVIYFLFVLMMLSLLITELVCFQWRNLKFCPCRKHYMGPLPRRRLRA